MDDSSQRRLNDTSHKCLSLSLSSLFVLFKNILNQQKSGYSAQFFCIISLIDNHRIFFLKLYLFSGIVLVGINHRV